LIFNIAVVGNIATGSFVMRLSRRRREVVIGKFELHGSTMKLGKKNAIYKIRRGS
jgi:hypothetical protein